MPEPSVAVIDIGSNSIKLLVATRESRGLRSLATRSIDARISTGISRAKPELMEESMARGLAAIRELLAAASPFAPKTTVLAATSAVREAANGGVFQDRVRHATGYDLRILTGDQEANLIGRGLACDPALGDLRDFYVFDLGGGSLECLAFRGRRVTQEVSLQLGCVRLTERFVADATASVSAGTTEKIIAHVRSTLGAAPFSFSLLPRAVTVGTGGTLTTARAVLAARTGRTLEQIPALVTVDEVRALLAELRDLPLAERQQVPGLPASRADVFPAALATLIALAEFGEFPAYRHSLYNLRYGLAAEALEAN